MDGRQVGLAEYALIAALVVVIVIAMVIAWDLA